MYRFRLLLCWGPDREALGDSSSSSSSTPPPGFLRFAPAVTSTGAGAPGVVVGANALGVVDDVMVSRLGAVEAGFFVRLSGLLLFWRDWARGVDIGGRRGLLGDETRPRGSELAALFSDSPVVVAMAVGDDDEAPGVMGGAWPGCAGGDWSGRVVRYRTSPT